MRFEDCAPGIQVIVTTRSDLRAEIIDKLVSQEASDIAPAGTTNLHAVYSMMSIDALNNALCVLKHDQQWKRVAIVNEVLREKYALAAKALRLHGLGS